MSFFEKLAGILLPPKCIFCAELLEPGAALQICNDCYSKVPFAEEAVVRTGTDGSDVGCDGAICVCNYSGIVRESLIRFKFYGKPGYYRTFARLLSERIRKLADVDGFDMLVSVPLHKRKQYARGYNQAFLISRALSRELRLPERSDLLKRLKDTDSQSLLDRDDRRRNVMDAFEVTAPEELEGKTVLLVDDILTTGFTMDECARMLKKAGAKTVIAAAVATGRR